MSRVHAGQQRQGGSENHFEAQVRHTGGKRKKGKKMSEKQRRKQLYASQAGNKFKPKSEHPGDCTCSICAEKRRAEKATTSSRTERGYRSMHY